MYRLTIQYSVPTDPEAFDRYYLDKHLPLVTPMAGLRSLTVTRPRPLSGDQTVHLVCELDFDDAEAMRAGLASPEMQAAAADGANLATPAILFAGEVEVIDLP